MTFYIITATSTLHKRMNDCNLYYMRYVKKARVRSPWLTVIYIYMHIVHRMKKKTNKRWPPKCALPVSEADVRFRAIIAHPRCADTSRPFAGHGEIFEQLCIHSDQSITLKFGVNDS